MLEVVEQAIKVNSVEDQRGALRQRSEERAPMQVECAPFDADILNRLGISQATLHFKLTYVASYPAAIREKLARPVIVVRYEVYTLWHANESLSDETCFKFIDSLHGRAALTAPANAH